MGFVKFTFFAPGRAVPNLDIVWASRRQFGAVSCCGCLTEANQSRLTTALGAGSGGRGAGIGAARGALGGAGLAAAQSSNALASIQAQFDNAFAACMALCSKLRHYPNFTVAQAAHTR